MAPTTHVGVALAVLVAVAAAVAAWLLFARADERARADDDRASDSAVEALESGPGRVIASLRGADALVDADGSVAPERFAALLGCVDSNAQPLGDRALADHFAHPLRAEIAIFVFRLEIVVQNRFAGHASIRA